MRNRKHPVDSGGVNLSLIVTPFLDMSFQILAFFIMTYHPSHFEGHIDGNLLPPANYAMKGPKSDPTKSDDLPAIDDTPELQDVLMVSVKTTTDPNKRTTDGEPRMVLLKRPEAPDFTRVSEGDTWDNAKKKLKESLEGFLKESGGDKTVKANIKLDGDSSLKHQYMMEAYDVCKQAGYNKISFVAPVPERKKE
jgi:biopolymer transport protein ExbD